MEENNMTKLEKTTKTIEGTLPVSEVERLAKEQGNHCYMDTTHQFDGYITVKGGEPITITAHGAQLVYQEPHEHVNIALCSACFSILTQQELPLTRTDVTPLLFITRKVATAGA
jgi:hypothetical protein